MKNNLIVRTARPDDAVGYYTLANLVWRDAYKNIFPEEVFAENEGKLEKLVATFEQRLFTNNSQIIMVAECNGKIVGFLVGFLKARIQSFADLEYAEIGALYIHPKFQHKGLGKKMKDSFVDWAKQNGATKFVVGVLKDNKQGRKAYEKWGGKLDNYTQQYLKLGKEYPEVFYTFMI